MSDAQRDDDRKQIRDDFDDAATMTASTLEEWLQSEDSRDVGQKQHDGDESTGHASGRRIVEILRKRQSELTDADYSHMRKVVGYVARHAKQRPDGDVEDTRWRYSLMNWGHDPL